MAMRLRDGLAVVHAAWMSWWSFARPRMEKSDRLHSAARAVSVAMEQLERALRDEETK